MAAGVQTGAVAWLKPTPRTAGKRSRAPPETGRQRRLGRFLAPRGARRAIGAELLGLLVARLTDDGGGALCRACRFLPYPIRAPPESGYGRSSPTLRPEPTPQCLPIDLRNP